jgi:hypothetical protein
MRARRAIWAAALVATILVAVAGRAYADHQDYYQHWGHGFEPWVSADCSVGSICNYTSYAEGTWNSNSYPNGFVTGSFSSGCGAVSGWIKTCWQTAQYVHSQPGCSTQQTQACTAVFFTTSEPTLHIDRATISVCNSCGFGPNGSYTVVNLRNILTHEYGHAIGLGHTTAANSVMQAILNNVDTVQYGPVQHDRDALAWMYERLTANETLCCGQQTRSANAYYRAIFQTDGNFVVYTGGFNGGSATWASNTQYLGFDHVTMQSDGNLVIYTPGNTYAACSTKTWGNPGAYMRLQSDGNLVVYSAGGVALWASRSNPCYR